MPYSIRHASAGDRDTWIGDDRARPLDDQGRQQAAALVELLRTVRSPACSRARISAASRRTAGHGTRSVPEYRHELGDDAEPEQA